VIEIILTVNQYSVALTFRT